MMSRRIPRFESLLAAVSWAYLAGVFAVTCLLLLASDRWWPATMILFGPRWIWAMPIGVIAPAAIQHRRALLAPLAVAASLALFTVMGFELPSPGVILADRSRRD